MKKVHKDKIFMKICIMHIKTSVSINCKEYDK